jgi:hypothetical protein
MSRSKHMDLIERQKDSWSVDPWSGRKLNSFSITSAEFSIIRDLIAHDGYLKEFDDPNIIRNFHGRNSDVLASPNNVLNYMRGLKKALDMCLETEDAAGMSARWQARLY